MEGVISMIRGQILARRTALYTSISMLSLMLASGVSYAQSTDIGSVDVQSKGALPLSAPGAVGSMAPAGSAPALAPAQGSLDSFEPGSIVSDKVLSDVIPPTSDYNEAGKFTPGFYSSNTNGLLGDSKSGWRGFQDGQFNITFDGIPFGDANDPTHHSAAYFPGAFLGSVTIDRGPGAASQVGYATFGGTMALKSYDLSDTFGGSVSTSFGSFNTLSDTATVQTGNINGSGVRGVFQFSHAMTNGALTDGKDNQNQFLGKVEAPLGNNFKITVFGTYGIENYTNVTSITFPQWQAYGKHYGAINNNPQTQQFAGYNNSQKQTDMEYVDIDGSVGDWHVDNKVYTYSYWYPSNQNNGADQTVEGIITAANNPVTKIKIPTGLYNPTTGKAITTSVTVKGTSPTDVIGYIKYNDYRAFGDIFNLSRDINAGFLSGTARIGVWAEQVDNTRMQQYEDYTTGQTFSNIGNSLRASFKLQLASHITNAQPFAEYEWRPIDRLTITPGFKFESFTRQQDGQVNQTTLQPIDYSHTYTAGMPFLSARYKLTQDVTVYAQASQGFLAPTVSAYYVFNPALGGIKPQVTTNYQAGTVYKTGKITADADVYQVTATNFPVVNTTSTGLQDYINGGTAQYRGIEAEGSYSIINGLSAYASGALIQAKYIAGANSGLRVGGAPSFTAAGGFIYDDGKFFGSALQKFTGDAYGSGGQSVNSSFNNASLNHIKGYNTTDMVIGVRVNTAEEFNVGKTAEFKLGIYNAFNHTNITDIGGGTGTASSPITNINNTNYTYSFLPGRLIIGSASFKF
jgi:iron complex outermembrane receptor protein